MKYTAYMSVPKDTGQSPKDTGQAPGRMGLAPSLPMTPGGDFELQQTHITDLRSSNMS